MIYGTPGLLEICDVTVLAFTIRNGKIVEIDVLADRRGLQHLDLTVLDV